MTQQWDATHYYSAHLTLSGSPLLTATSDSGAGWQPAYATEWFTTGKYYSEYQFSGAARPYIGGGNSAASVALASFPGFDANAFGWDVRLNGGSGNLFFNDATPGVPIPAMTGPVFGMAWDLVAGYVWFKDVTANSGWFALNTTPGDPTLGASGGGYQLDSTMRAGGNGLGVSPAIGLVNAGDSITAGFASSSWIGTPPTGFLPFDPSVATGVPVWLYFGQLFGAISMADVLALGAGFKLTADLIRNPIRSRRRLLTGRDDR